jgi:uncharacterized protein YyaL (SSP411 family)
MRLGRCCGLLLVILITGQPAPTQAASALASDPSPYLRMHADDPVAWRPLDEAALAEARKQGRPLFVTVGYFSCYWCHVMQRESFVDPGVAARLNTDYVPVVVDRELAPGVDAVLIEFVERTRGHSGWPLNVVLTPDGYPLFGTTYLPRDRFLELLDRMAGLWREERPALEEAARAAAARMARPPLELTPELDLKHGPAYRALLVDVALGLADELAGGFGDQAKFPDAPQLLALLAARNAVARPELDDFLGTTLDAMAGLGLRDLVGGGFFRYTTDPQWQEPHFEKMLYDNAQLALVYLEAATAFGAPAYADVAFDALDFVLRDLARGDGSFAASLSAVDAAGEEGAAYLWDDVTLARLLGRERHAAVRVAWGVDGPPAFDAGHLPMTRHDAAVTAGRLGRDEAEVARWLAEARAILAAERAANRPVPRDDKALAGWNGLLLEALAAAVAQPDGARFRVTGAALRDHLVGVAWDGRELARLVHDGGRVAGRVEDYAHVARGLEAWAAAVDDPEAATVARKVADAGFRRFFDTAGWRLADPPLLPVAPRDAALPDRALRSPSALLAGVALRFGVDDPAWRTRALTALNVPEQVLLAEPFWHATQIATLARIGAFGE